MYASTFGRIDNVKFWLDRFPDWDMERKNKVAGSSALGTAVYMGPHRLELVKLLLKHGASTSLKNFSGASILTTLCSSEDCDPKIVDLVLKHESQSVNYRRRGQSLKWRNIYRLARICRTGFSLLVGNGYARTRALCLSGADCGRLFCLGIWRPLERCLGDSGGD